MPKTKKTWKSLWCCNPFGLERHSKQVGKRKVTLNMCKKVPHLVLGDSICHSCRLKVAKINIPDEDNGTEVGRSTSEEEGVHTDAGRSTSEEEYVPESTEDRVSNLNKLLTPLGESPVSKPKLSRVKSYAERKASTVTRAISESIFNISTGSEMNDAQEMINQFKEKFATSKTANEKYMILTCLPKSWSEHKIISEFGVSSYVAHVAKQTQINKGTMSVPDRTYKMI